jgi:hypothetical protein
LGGQRIGDERYKRKQIVGYRSADGEPCGIAGGKIGSEYEFKSNKVRNALFHDRYPLRSNLSFFTVTSKELNQGVGMISILNVIQQMKTLELGNIWYSPIVHFSKVNTEVVSNVKRNI